LAAAFASTLTQKAQRAMATLTKICEDDKKLLDKDYQGQRQLNILPLAAKFPCRSTLVRGYARASAP
jgi:hypothetical protein